jgi:hypothetical protein
MQALDDLYVREQFRDAGVQRCLTCGKDQGLGLTETPWPYAELVPSVK